LKFLKTVTGIALHEAITKLMNERKIVNLSVPVEAPTRKLQKEIDKDIDDLKIYFPTNRGLILTSVQHVEAQRLKQLYLNFKVAMRNRRNMSKEEFARLFKPLHNLLIYLKKIGAEDGSKDCKKIKFLL